MTTGISHAGYYSELKNNFATLGAVSTISFTVPADKRWYVYGGTVERDQSAALDVAFYDADDHLIMALSQVAAGTTKISWGFAATAVLNILNAPLPLDAGSYVKYTWGAAQTTPEVTCYIMETPL